METGSRTEQFFISLEHDADEKQNNTTEISIMHRVFQNTLTSAFISLLLVQCPLNLDIEEIKLIQINNKTDLQ